MKTWTLIIFLLVVGALFSMGANAREIILKKGHTFEIKEGFAKYESGKFIFAIDKLKMNDDSRIVISDGYAGKKLVLRINEFIGKGQNTIIQDFGRKEPIRWKLSNYDYTKHPRAKQGDPGADIANTAPKGHGGATGRKGKIGSKGRDSVELFFEMGITQVEDLKIVLLSESGGHGGFGGRGQKGGRADCPKKSGSRGGDGGKGGMGGRPGAVGPVDFTWWELAPVISSNDGFPINISVILIPGASGQPGFGGPPGAGGDGKRCTIYNLSVGSDGNFGRLGDYIDPNRYIFFGAIQSVKARKILK